MLTLFHGEKFCEDLNKMSIDEEIKNSFTSLINEFLKDLFHLAQFNPHKEMNASFKDEIHIA